MFSKVSIICCCSLVLAGCVYNDEPMPEIEHNSTNSSVRSIIFEPPKTHSNVSGNMPRGWLPPGRLENRKRWRAIVIHHSFPIESGSSVDIDKLHKKRGFDGLGYHFVITNGRGAANGRVEVGYRWRQQLTGAHCRVAPYDDNYWNKYAIGICLIGNFEKNKPSQAQYRSLAKLVRFLQKRYNIPTRQIKGHGDIKPTDCPGKNFSFNELRRHIVRYK